MSTAVSDPLFLQAMHLTTSLEKRFGKRLARGEADGMQNQAVQPALSKKQHLSQILQGMPTVQCSFVLSWQRWPEIPSVQTNRLN